jgi:Tol biopolymer transport system component
MDGKQLIFSMVSLQPAPASSWLDKLFGVGVASAHSVPSDWYRAPLSGGVPERLTYMGYTNLNGDLSPDGNQLAFISASGLYVMNLDGSDLIQLSNDVMIGTVNWIP